MDRVVYENVEITKKNTDYIISHIRSTNGGIPTNLDITILKIDKPNLYSQKKLGALHILVSVRVSITIDGKFSYSGVDYLHGIIDFFNN